jgi:pimeloyl-ACP methyl ester carboxylesterase
MTDWIEVDGRRLAYESWGLGPDVVLIGGIGMDLKVWRNTYVDGLVQAGYRALAICPPGLAPSDMPASPCSVAYLARLWDEALRQLGVGPCFVIGASLGALIAQELALMSPQGKSGLVLIAPTGRVTRWVQLLTDGELGLEGKDLPFKDGYVVASDLLQLMSPAELLDDELVERMLQQMVVASPAQQKARHMLLAAMQGYGNRLDALAQLAMPALLVSFAQDALTPAGLAQELAGRLRRARHVCIDGAGHFGIFSMRKRVLQEVVAFFGNVRN